MIPEHRHELQQFHDLFKNDKMSYFEERLKILEAFLRTENHITIKELEKLIEDSGQSVMPGLVEETMALMVKFGFAMVSKFDNGLARYEHRHLGQHHDHMICTKCRKIIEFENENLEKLQKMIAETYGFHMLRHRMEIYGLCPACVSEQKEKKPLSFARSGEKLVISGIGGGRRANMRLRSMGLNVGDTIEIVNVFGGQLVIALNNARLVIGQGLAKKILVAGIS